MNGAIFALLKDMYTFAKSVALCLALVTVANSAEAAPSCGQVLRKPEAVEAHTDFAVQQAPLQVTVFADKFQHFDVGGLHQAVGQNPFAVGFQFRGGKAPQVFFGPISVYNQIEFKKLNQGRQGTVSHLWDRVHEFPGDELEHLCWTITTTEGRTLTGVYESGVKDQVSQRFVDQMTAQIYAFIHPGEKIKQINTAHNHPRQSPHSINDVDSSAFTIGIDGQKMIQALLAPQALIQMDVLAITGPQEFYVYLYAYQMN